MRIGILCHASCGGSGRVATELSKELARRGHQVHLFAHTPPFGLGAVPGLTLHTLWPEARQHPADLYTQWRPDEEEALVSRIVEVTRRERLDLLHFHYAVPFAWLAQAVRTRLGPRWHPGVPPIVGTLHGTDVLVHGQAGVTAARLRAALLTADVLTAVSYNLALLARQVFCLQATPQIIPNFIDPARFQAAPRPAGRPILLHMSNFRAIKSPQRLVGIFDQIRAEVDAEMWLVGDGPELADVRALLDGAGHRADVRYWGLQRDVRGLVAQASLLLVTSDYESFCLAALEAMASGVPVLATRVGGLPEVVMDGHSGLLLPPDDLGAFARAGVALLRDEPRRLAMRQAAVRQAHRFATARIVPLYESLYANLVMTGPRRVAPLPGLAGYGAGRPVYEEGSRCEQWLRCWLRPVGQRFWRSEGRTYRWTPSAPGCARPRWATFEQRWGWMPRCWSVLSSRST
jgi:N-acetyl-alpha-D-glucosaminyl L-malate synthase BshA